MLARREHRVNGGVATRGGGVDQACANATINPAIAPISAVIAVMSRQVWALAS